MKHSMIITAIGDPSEKGNSTIKLSYKKGLVKQSLYLLTDAEDAKALKLGDDISEQIPTDFVIRKSTMIGDEGQEIVTKWIELL